jgi:hypothetical protein
VGSNDEDDGDGSSRSWDEGDLMTGMSPLTQSTGATELEGIKQYIGDGGKQHGTASIASFCEAGLGRDSK